MKYLNFCVAILLCLVSLPLLAQTPKQIEDDLLKSFKRIDFWFEKTQDTTYDALRANDSLGKTNEVFAKKLISCIEKFPSTITYPFNSLKKNYLNISTSTDGRLRIYSWDDMTGGTMRYFENIFQYKSGTKTIAMHDASEAGGDYGPAYEILYTFKIQDKTYYLVTILEIGSSKDLEKGIQVFSIENGKLNTDTKIIKTKSGLHSQITYDYDLSRTSEKIHSEIHFDANTKSIYIPVVLENGKLTNNYITYKFTGQYFERVKN